MRAIWSLRVLVVACLLSFGAAVFVARTVGSWQVIPPLTIFLAQQFALESQEAVAVMEFLVTWLALLLVVVALVAFQSIVVRSTRKRE